MSTPVSHSEGQYPSEMVTAPSAPSDGSVTPLRPSRAGRRQARTERRHRVRVSIICAVVVFVICGATLCLVQMARTHTPFSAPSAVVTRVTSESVAAAPVLPAHLAVPRLTPHPSIPSLVAIGALAPEGASQ